MRQNLIPGIALLILGLTILFGYYLHDPTQHKLDQLAQFKDRWGFIYSMISTSIFGGLIPLLFMQLRRDMRGWKTLKHLPWMIIFWASKGFEFDLLYRVQAWIWGEGVSVGTVAIKTTVDQLIYVPFWAVPTIVFGYLLMDVNYNLREFRRRLGKHWFRDRAFPTMVSNWGVWVPAVIIIYSLPLGLQVPTQNLVQCMFSLMLLFVMKTETADATEVAPGIESPASDSDPT